MATLDYYINLSSPYAYLAGRRPEEIARRHGLALRFKPVDALGLFARTGGKPLPERHPSRQAYRLADITRIAARQGVALTPQPAFYPANGAPASYAVIAAQDVAESGGGGGDVGALVMALMTACWAEEKNIAEDAVIKTALDGAGFAPSLADSGLFTGAAVYERNLEEAVAAGVFGVPSWVTPDGALFWGQDRLDDLDAHLAAGAGGR